MFSCLSLPVTGREFSPLLSPLIKRYSTTARPEGLQKFALIVDKSLGSILESSNIGQAMQQHPKDFRFTKQVPEGDTHERHVCGDCGWIHYINPKIVVGAVVSYDGGILLCRRAIEPRKGFWTIPAGYMEERETSEAGAMREACEEACADIVIDSLLAVYNIPRISQVQLIYRATLVKPEFSAGPESLEVQLFGWNEIPWEELAFPSVHWALRQFREVEGKAAFPTFTNPPGEFGNY